jgi:phosphatidylethanolamine N-methyltransferase
MSSKRIETEEFPPQRTEQRPELEGNSSFGYGKTADGQGSSNHVKLTQKEFLVPPTSDLIEHLLDPSSPKTLLDAPIILAIVVQIIAFLLKSKLPSWIYVLTFLGWRMAYNVGLGYILKQQSEKRTWERWTTRYGFAEKGKDVDTLPPRSQQLVKTVRSELERHMGGIYKYDSVPHAFNSWLLFRFLVDLILVNDFVAYWIMALVFWNWPGWSWTWLDVMRYVVGIFLVQFNVWVKLDAHRVVKDYAWYWGDFFFLPTTFNLTFDGVFELAPHPMYSVGYIGYYGIALMSKSYVVLFASLFAHACQFTFLMITETPHIDKVYGSENHKTGLEREVMRAYFGRDLVVLRNVDLFRSGDMLSFILAAQSILIALYFGKDALKYLVVQAMFWRLFHTGLLGLMLHLQSTKNRWNRHFIKHGDGVKQGFEQWKIIFNASMAMMYVSFWMVVWQCYSFPTWQELFHGPALLRHTIAVLLIVLHIYAAASIYEVLGDYGWFYGDFFLPSNGNLKYTGIYRFLNNPEKLMGHASFWAATLLAPQPVVFFLAGFGHLLMWLFLEFVEKPHMQRLYGSNVREWSGVEKVVRNEVSSRIDRAPLVKTVVEKVPEVVKAVEGVVRRRVSDESSMSLKVSQSFNQLSGDLKEVKDGLIEQVETLMLPTHNLDAYNLAVSPRVEYGEDIKVDWEAPADEFKSTDWIGLYRGGDLEKVTMSRSNGCWQYPIVQKTWEKDGVNMVGGTCTFSNDSLVWDWGNVVARYHYDNKYGVLATAKTVIELEPVPVNHTPSFLGPKHRMHGLDPSVVVEQLLPVARKCFNKSDLTAELDLNEVWKQSGTIGTSVDLRLEEKQCTRLVRAIWRMYGVELSWRVVARDETLEALSKRVCF